MMNRVFLFIKKEIVLFIAGVLAMATAFVVHPSKAYIDYIDFRVLALLFSLMLVVAALKSFGVFTAIINATTAKVSNTRILYLVLVFVCFFSGMVITNDVALITFVPFAIELLSIIGRKKHLIYIIVLQTVAANLGSMVTPIGNPQNIYIYNTYNMGMEDFFLTLMPYAILAIILLVAAVCILPSEKISKELDIAGDKNKTGAVYGATVGGYRYRLVLTIIVFLACIACVVRILDYRIMLAIAVVLIGIIDFRLFKKADYLLLLTFVAFFIMTGNIKAIDTVNTKLSDIMAGREILVSIVSSQLISNVPAAVLLSNFTAEGRLLLIGTNIGGLGTIIASMASLISFRYYSETEDCRKGKYLGIFTLVNLLFLAAAVILMIIIM